MANDEKLEKLLEDQLIQLGFKPVAREEVERVEASVKEKVAKPVAQRLEEQQEQLEKVRTWYVSTATR